MVATGFPSGPSQLLAITLDEQGHCQDASCTWAPPASHTHSNYHMQSLSGIPAAHNPATAKSFTMKSPAAEYSPPLYTLPSRSSNSYEEACKTHHELGVCHASHYQGALQQDEVKPPKCQRISSWRTEDQKRLQHMRFIYGEVKEAKTF